MFAAEIFALLFASLPWVLGKAILLWLWEVLLRFFSLAVSFARPGHLGLFTEYKDEFGPPSQTVIIKPVVVALPSPVFVSTVDVNPLRVPPPACRPGTILEMLRCSFPGCSCFLGAPCLSLARETTVLRPSSASPVLSGCEAITKAWLLANSSLSSSPSGGPVASVFGSPVVPSLEEMDICLASPLVSVAPRVSIPVSGSAVSSAACLSSATTSTVVASTLSVPSSGNKTTSGSPSCSSPTSLAAEVSSSPSPTRVIAAPKGVRSHRVREQAELKTLSATPSLKGDKGLKRLSVFADRQDGK
ncbi:hypothetical protein INT47_003729 [Mucor saturninus]|uniref:Uncharacterized protein n=1 Tax=Mucor saturninus TaxID=64648 RepID=A0A8H7UU13_9FUNG|nr:hypothetical protein INT47_003729 [Mucor saturninus]